ncbi:EamA family transporter [Jatrophihabitans fulvus]
MTTRDRLLALLVAATWGVNFPATHYALEQFPPFLLVAVRFALIAVPTVLFVPRPAVQWCWLLGYGTGFGVLQFAFLYLGMANGMPSGLASLVLQSSAPFTVVLGALLLRERVSGRQALGIAVALCGLGVIAVHRSTGGSAALVPVLLTIAGGFGWALGNLANRQARSDSPLRLTLWMSIVPPLPMLALSFAVEGPHEISRSITGLAHPAAIPAVLGLLYIVLVATIVGSGIWTTLMARNPAGVVAPFSMAVPAVGLVASWAMLGETVDAVEAVGAVVVVVGILLAARSGRRTRRRRDYSMTAERESRTSSMSSAACT